MRRAIVKNLPNFLLVVALAATGLGVGGYILSQQGFRFPILDDEPVRFEMAFTTAQAVTPGQGQTVQVAGVRIGTIESVRLENGRGIVGVAIEPEHASLVRRESRALLRPRTALKDMYIQLLPALEQPPAPAGYRVPVQNTLPDVDLHEILTELDERTRDYVRLFAAGAARGLDGQGEELAEVFRRFRPTLRDLARVNRAVAAERASLRRVVTAMAQVNGELARRPRELAQLVDASAATFGAFASEDGNLREAISELAPTLQSARRTLGELRPFARELGPAARALVPAVRRLDASNPPVRRFAERATPVVRERIRPFVRAARPVLADLAPAAQGLAATAPELRRDLRVVNRFANMLAFNPRGPEPPGSEEREEGYLFWLAWVAHQTVNLINVDDANGPLRPIFLTGTCTTLQTFIESEGVNAALGELGLGLGPLFANVCGDDEQGDPSTDVDALLKVLPPRLIRELPQERLRDADPRAAEKIGRALAQRGGR